MNKNTIIFIISLIFFSFLTQKELKSQDYGTTMWYESLNATNRDGFKPPLTKKEEKIRRKAKRLSLTHKDIQVLNLKDRDKKLTLKQKLRYPFANRKKKKLEKLQKQYDNYTNTKGSAQPGYMQDDSKKNELTIDEKILLEKVENDTIEMTKKEKRLYKRALRKQKRAEKQKNKYKHQAYTEEEQALVEKLEKEPSEITKEDKQKLKEFKQKYKHNEKVDERIYQYRLDSAYAVGAPMPVAEKKFRSPKISFKKKRMKPSSYMKKKMRLERKYNTPPRSFTAITQKKSENEKLSPRDMKKMQKYYQKKPANDWIYKQKMDKLNEKEFKKNQLKSTRKNMKKREKESEALQKGRKKYLRKTKFINLFKKKK